MNEIPTENIQEEHIMLMSRKKILMGMQRRKIKYDGCIRMRKRVDLYLQCHERGEA